MKWIFQQLRHVKSGRIFLSFLMLLFYSYCFGQTTEIKDLYDKIQNNTPSYLRQAQRITYKLFKEYSAFYKFEYTRSEFKKFDFIVIPMFDLHLKSQYLNPEVCILNYIKTRKNTNLSNIIIFREGKYYATCSCTEYLPYSIILPESEFDTTRSLVKQLELIKPYNNYTTFYIRGFLHTWWLVNRDGDVKIYNILDDKFYEYNEFMNQYFPPEQVRVVLKRYYDQ
jgi:hypothetical protein